MMMRTTLTIDDDIVAKLQSSARKSGRSFKEVVNDALRNGLALEAKAKRLPPFRIEASDLVDLKPGLNYDKVEEIFDELDSPGRLR
jgi:hypothetical protein